MQTMQIGVKGMQRVTSREFQRNFGRCQDEALKAPLAITRNGRDRLVILSVDEYERLKRRDRQALAVEELSNAEIEAISRAEPPAEAAQYDHEFDGRAWRGFLIRSPDSSSATLISGGATRRRVETKAPSTALLSSSWQWSPTTNTAISSLSPRSRTGSPTIPRPGLRYPR